MSVNGSGPPFRAEHIGSFQRPDALMKAVRDARAGNATADEVRAAQDAAIRDLVAFEEEMGLKSVTDGEFRRRGWSAGFIDAVEGFGLREGAIGFRTEDGDAKLEKSPYAQKPLRRTRPIVVEDFKFIAGLTSRTPKVTMASPPVMHYFLGPRAVEETVYPDMDVYYDDLAAIYRAEIAALAEAGCTYLQLDETALPCHCDTRFREDVVARGEDPEQLTARYAKLINAAVDGRPDNMTVGIHMCRGNLKGTWMAEGGYDPIADVIFNQVNVDAFFLEYDTERAGDFAPLRHMGPDKHVVLGLVSTKTPELESADDLKRRIDEAAKYIPLERLSLSPQCGFASAPGSGQVITHDDERRKLALIVGIAEDVWGSA